MSQFVVEKPFWDIFPEVRIALIRVTGLDNQDHGQLPASILEDANAHVADLIPDDPISANPLIHEWREAFRKFKTKKGARCAVENLLKRSKNGNPVRSIDPWWICIMRARCERVFQSQVWIRHRFKAISV
ncbi:hypothetical protein [Secundilactobacillus paracollinoides]|uniref:hypothetical protein n=1 Tax=Secundilactobacillus paracollinoides TaxID=240427 RepID=UPI000AD9BD62|nr:hypothetical protein [Secundilactobacillus paracollinoides]